jgi:hypothetical protein
MLSRIWQAMDSNERGNRMILYHSTNKSASNAIIAEGFRDRTTYIGGIDVTGA